MEVFCRRSARQLSRSPPASPGIYWRARSANLSWGKLCAGKFIISALAKSYWDDSNGGEDDKDCKSVEESQDEVGGADYDNDDCNGGDYDDAGDDYDYDHGDGGDEDVPGR